jgi:anti-sigma factor RsiW
MKCEEVRSLHGPYLDSELDAKNSLEIERHLAACPACARLFAEAKKLDARLMAGLNRGPRTAPLWEQIEGSVTAVAASGSRPRPTATVTQPVGWPAVLVALGTQLRAGWRTSRWAWSGLAAAWVVILTLNFAGRESDAPLVAGQAVPSASEIRFALKQNHLLMAELALTSEPAPADKPKAAPPRPRSDRRNETLNA